MCAKRVTLKQKKDRLLIEAAGLFTKTADLCDQMLYAHQKVLVASSP